MPKPTLKAEIFRGRNHKNWYWRLRARNGEVVAASESYARKDGAKRGARRVLGSGSAVVREVKA